MLKEEGGASVVLEELKEGTGRKSFWWPWGRLRSTIFTAEHIKIPKRTTGLTEVHSFLVVDVLTVMTSPLFITIDSSIAYFPAISVRCPA